VNWKEILDQIERSLAAALEEAGRREQQWEADIAVARPSPLANTQPEDPWAFRSQEYLRTADQALREEEQILEGKEKQVRVWLSTIESFSRNLAKFGPASIK
jgi:hypothetical protein